MNNQEKAMVTSFSIGCVVMILLSISSIFFMYRKIPFQAVGLGWLLAIGNGMVACWINNQALCQNRKSIFWGVGLNGIRALLFMSILVGIRLWGIQNFYPFLISTVIGYLAFLFAEVIHIHLVSLKMEEVRHEG